MKTILLLGGNGQVGWQLRRSLSIMGQVSAPRIDLRDRAALAEIVTSLRPAIVVNAAAYTAVDRAEDEPEAAYAVNARACETLAAETRRAATWLVHYSSDYVYDGAGERPWVETDVTEPLGVYGKSKLEGDIAVATNPRHLIFRTSWVFDTWGQNFAKSILKAAATREQLTVVNDQWGAPTRAALIADVTAYALGQLTDDKAGMYHVAAAGVTNWNEYAKLVIQVALNSGKTLRVRPEQVLSIPSSGYPTRARRPSNSRLDTGKLRKTFGLHLPPWEHGVREVVSELAEHSKNLH